MFFGSSKKDQWVKRFSSQSTSVPSCIFSGIISIFCQSTLYRFNACPPAAQRRRLGRTMPAAAAILQWFDFSESYTNIFEGCAVFLESQPRYLGKIHLFAWLSIPFGEQAFHKTISQKNAKNLHVILAWICLLRFFSPSYTEGKTSRYVVHYV